MLKESDPAPTSPLHFLPSQAHRLLIPHLQEQWVCLPDSHVLTDQSSETWTPLELQETGIFADLFFLFLWILVS